MIPIDAPQQLPQLLRAFGLSPAEDSRYLPHGLMNRNWRIDTAEGTFALKQIDDVTASLARRNLAVLAPLAATGLPVAPPVPGEDGELVVEIDDSAFYLFPWMEGVRTPGTELPKGRAESLGTLLGHLHLRLNDPSIGLPRTEPAPATLRTASEARAEADRYLAAIANRRFQCAFDVAAAEAMEQRLNLVAAHGGSQPPAAVPECPAGWIHGDFTSSNLLWSDGRVTGILDWDRLRTRPFGEELARAAILHFKSDDGSVDLGRVTAFVSGYRRVIPISPEASADAVHRLWWHYLTNFWIPARHYDREDFTCDYLLRPRENLLHWWTAHRDEVHSAFTADAP